MKIRPDDGDIQEMWNFFKFLLCGLVGTAAVVYLISLL